MKYVYCMSCGAVYAETTKKCYHGCGETLVESKTKGTLYVEWAPGYIPVSDFAIEESYELLIDSARRQFANPYNHLVYKAGFSTGNIFTRIRLGVARKELEFPVIFVYQGHEMPLNKYGASDNWIEGFTEYTAHLSQLLMDEAIKLRRKDREKEKHLLPLYRAINLLASPLRNSDYIASEDDYIEYVKSGRRIFMLYNEYYRMCYNKRDGFYYKYVGEYRD